MTSGKQNQRTARRLASMLLCAVAISYAATPAKSQLLEDVPDDLQGVGITEKLGEQIPLDLEFVDENGEKIKLSDLFQEGRPIILSLNYSTCPMLCRVQLDGLVEGLKQMEWTVGDEFEVVSVSIDPLETPDMAKKTEQRYLAQYERPGSAKGWRFLTGEEPNIKKLADAVGFGYKYVPSRGEYAHTAAAIICTPEGVVSRYLTGVMYEPRTMRLSLVEASEGEVGSFMDQALLYCFHYDSTTGRYGPAARQIMKVGGAVTLLALAVGLTPFWFRRSTTKKGEGVVDAETPIA